ncbi:MAG: non-canonical purine NTP pyrophosphatase [Actinomycetes bacterium]
MSRGPQSLILATGNDHKVLEFSRLLPGMVLEGLPPGVELPPEVGTTYAQNALGKAWAAATATGSVAIADDSGIEAEDLAGAPGIRSARFAGETASDDQNLELLEERVPAGGRLTYVCLIAIVDPIAKIEKIFEGRCNGTMSAKRSGSKGFGYDPVFIPEDGDGVRTMADLSDQEKDRISHRGIAANQLLKHLNSLS